MNRDVIVKIGGTSGAGKSTVALIIENALLKAGIPFLYEEDDLEIRERTLEFVERRERDLKEDKIKDYGISVKLKTCQLNRECCVNGVTEEDIKEF